MHLKLRIFTLLSGTVQCVQLHLLVIWLELNLKNVIVPLPQQVVILVREPTSRSKIAGIGDHKRRELLLTF